MEIGPASSGLYPNTANALALHSQQTSLGSETTSALTFMVSASSARGGSPLRGVQATTSLFNQATSFKK